LEDQAGFVNRDRDFPFQLSGQVLGPVEVLADESLAYSLSLPAIPQGTLVDVDNDDQNDKGVQIFAVAYWSNVWGDPFLELRDGTGWSNSYTSAIIDAGKDDEIIGGTLIVWAPDDQQEFPVGFGADGLLFTPDDPIAPIPAGYNLVDLNQEPFRVYKESQPNLSLNEGVSEVNDYSEMNYVDSFQALFEKVSREYPFTDDKGINWQALNDQFAPSVAQAKNKEDYYRALRDLTYSIPDGHVNVSINPDVFYEERGGGFGLVLAELSDGRVIVTEVLPNTPGEKAGIKPGAEILTWNNKPVKQAIEETIPYFGPYSTDHTKHLEQANFLTRVPPGSKIDVQYKNPGDLSERKISMSAEVEYESLFRTIPVFNQDELAIPLEGKVLDDSGLGYIRISTFSDDYNFMARLWEHNIQALIDQEIPGLIIDLRTNGGGSVGLSLDFAGYFFDEEIELYDRYYYNETTGEFESTGQPAKIKPGPLYYDGPIAVLVSPNCVSACEGFAYALTQNGRSMIVGHFATAGAFGEVGRGQYKLPDDITMQFPTGRPETLDGELLIEGIGVLTDVTVPVSEESAIGLVDAVLQAAVNALLEKIR
jgi:C-terminal processing protease CtpA/Prc